MNRHRIGRALMLGVWLATAGAALAGCGSVAQNKMTDGGSLGGATGSGGATGTGGAAAGLGGGNGAGGGNGTAGACVLGTSQVGSCVLN